MIIQHNLTAMNANRMMGLTKTRKAKTTEKLSSGYRINRSADDAAGLAISEKMRRQIRGLTQASYNCQDGVSLCQIADGALNEVHEMLKRCEELEIVPIFRMYRFKTDEFYYTTTTPECVQFIINYLKLEGRDLKPEDRLFKIKNIMF